MGFVKRYKNAIILILIVSSIVFSTKIIEFGSFIIKKVDKMFSVSKPDYSNLSSKGYKVKSSAKPSSKPASSSSSSGGSASNNSGAKSMFKNTKKEPSPEELDKQIMDKQNNPNQRDLQDPRSNRKFDNAVNEKKMSEQKFDMDMEKEFDNF